MSNRTFRLLIEAALRTQPFDDSAYLRANPDVARSVRDGRCPSGQAHYCHLGYFEERSPGKAEFDEAWYLERYPDIKRAVALGHCASAHEHYAGAGVREWRSPRKAVEGDVYRWHQAVLATVQATLKIGAPPAAAARKVVRRRAKA